MRESGSFCVTVLEAHSLKSGRLHRFGCLVWPGYGRGRGNEEGLHVRSSVQFRLYKECYYGTTLQAHATSNWGDLSLG